MCAAGLDRQPDLSGSPRGRHVIFQWSRREIGECLHHDTPLSQSLAALVGLFGVVTRDVVQAMLDDLLLEVGFFLSPGPERGAKPVHGQGFVSGDLLQMLEHRHVGDRLIQAATGEDELVTHAALVGLAQIDQGLPGQWRALWPFVLGVSGAQISQSTFEIEFWPAHVLHLDRSR